MTLDKTEDKGEQAVSDIVSCLLCCGDNSGIVVSSEDDLDWVF